MPCICAALSAELLIFTTHTRYWTVRSGFCLFDRRQAHFCATMKATLLLTLTWLLSGPSIAQGDALCELTVKVENIKDLKGRLKLAVYDQDAQFLKTALTWADQEIKEHTVSYTFKGLKKGTYAVSIFQDENENGKLDANFFGIPSEPYAFSNNARGMFGPPSFEDCQFEVIGGLQEITIRL